jgi:quercetin dioxygenase-like cupin family protein
MTPDIILGDASEYAVLHNDAFPLFVRLLVFKNAEDQEPEHVHRDGHFTALLKGKALFKIEGKLVEYSAPQLVWIAAGSKHQITALEDDTQCACIHDKRAFI